MKKLQKNNIYQLKVNYPSTPNLLLQNRHCITPNSLKSSHQDILKTTKEKVKINILNIDQNKKYSILAVPKTQTHDLITIKTPTVTPTKKNELNDNYSAIDTDDNTINDVKSTDRPFIAFGRIRSAYKTRKNPNQENLTTALLYTDKKNLKSPINTIENSLPPEKFKSDIEKLLESQMNPYLNKEVPKKIINKLDTNKVKPEDTDHFQDTFKKDLNNETQRSDPSPVREKLNQCNEKRSKTPKKTKLVRATSSKLKFLPKSKAGKELMERYQNQKEVLEFITNKVNLSVVLAKQIYDYRQESLKILKDTSFFANKIMKGIRCPGRIKKFY
jgi:hypothetical protein